MEHVINVTVTNVYAPLKGAISDGPETSAFGRTEG